MEVRGGGHTDTDGTGGMGVCRGTEDKGIRPGQRLVGVGVRWAWLDPCGRVVSITRVFTGPLYSVHAVDVCHKLTYHLMVLDDHDESLKQK